MMTDLSRRQGAAFTATHFDGESARPHKVDLRIDEARRVLLGQGLSWPLEEIREVPDQAGQDILVLRLKDDPVQRLVLPDRSLAARLPLRRAIPAQAPRGMLMAWGMAALTSVAIIIFVLVPVMANQLAEYIPPDGERALGEVTLDQIRGALDDTGLQPVPFCTGAEGQAALDAMEARLTQSLDLPYDLSVHVLDDDMVNAFALPGGYIVFFRGLFDAAETPEEVAAVFAHEIGHVVSRDPTRNALRSAGSIGVLGLLFGDFAGGALVLFLAERLIEAQYSQDAEARADVFAHDLLRRSDIAPSALADMFERFRAMGGDAPAIMTHFLSHPEPGDRIDEARKATPDGFQARPLLSDTEWRALNAMCD